MTQKWRKPAQPAPSCLHLRGRSLIEDYGVDPAKITVIGSSGHLAEPYTGDRILGSKLILFYCGKGPDFCRKGADRVLAAFRIVRQQIPDAKLAIVGMSSEITDAWRTMDMFLA